jgi:hypothetical protein
MNGEPLLIEIEKITTDKGENPVLRKETILIKEIHLFRPWHLTGKDKIKYSGLQLNSSICMILKKHDTEDEDGEPKRNVLQQILVNESNESLSKRLGAFVIKLGDS